MKAKLIKIVKWSIIGIVIAIIVFDVVLLLLGYTISEAMRDWESLEGWWIAPYYGSTILGHFWIHIWKEHNRWTRSWYRYLALVGLGVLTLFLNLTILRETNVPWYITIPGGLGTGAILWPQLKKKQKTTSLN
jgi:hypothetical protein